MKHLATILMLSAASLFAEKTLARANCDQPDVSQYSMSELQTIADSILMEGNLLALYERAAWYAGDQFQTQNDEIKSKFGGYLVCHGEDGNVRVVFSDRTQDELYCICEVIFYDNLENPMECNTAGREFTESEKNLWTVRDIITGNIEKNGISLTSYENFPFNHIIFPIDSGYRFYLFSGTILDKVFPFGNDYFFDSDSEGNIIKWRKMHSRLIAEPMEYENSPIREMSHSHILSEPFITPTDICTFQLYAPFSTVKILKVYSTALKLYFVYDWAENTITIEKTEV